MVAQSAMPLDVIICTQEGQTALDIARKALARMKDESHKQIAQERICL
jgi:hypothetical protein